MKMKRPAVYIALGFAGILLISATGLTQMMGNMRGMMQNMMGDRLPPGINPALMPEPHSKGAHLIEHYCTQCHKLPGPGMHTAAEWPGVVLTMNSRMQMMSQMGMTMMGKIAAPSQQELDDITAYLKKNAQQPITSNKYPLDSPAGKAFSFTCAQCHSLPEPTQHTAQEWPGVVARMREHETAMGKIVPDDKTTEEIIGFLQRYARS